MTRNDLVLVACIWGLGCGAAGTSSGPSEQGDDAALDEGGSDTDTGTPSDTSSSGDTDTSPDAGDSGNTADSDTGGAGDTDDPGDTDSPGDSDNPGDSDPALDPTAPLVVGLIGSSTPAGKNLDQIAYGGRVGGLADRYYERYLAYLNGTRPGTTGVDLAKPGYNTFYAMPTGTTNPAGFPAVDTSRNIDAVLAGNPDFIIVDFVAPGMSTGGTVATSAQVLANLVAIVNKAESVGVPAWVATPHPVQGAASGDIDLALERCALILAELGDHALDFWTPLADAGGRNVDPLYVQSGTLTDDIHPNALGHEQLFNVVVNADIPGHLTGP